MASQAIEKNGLINELDAYKGQLVSNTIQPIDSIEKVAEDKAASTANDPLPDQMQPEVKPSWFKTKEFWIGIGITASVALVVYLTIRYKWYKYLKP